MKKRGVIGGGILAFLFLFVFWQITPLDSQGKEKMFIIPQGEGTVAVCRRLEEEGLVRNRYFCLALIYGLGLKGKIQAGLFRLNPAMTAPEIIQTLTRGRIDRWLTIVEGKRREEIADFISGYFPFKREDFLAASRGKEGYLFPDTYLFPLKATPEKIVAIMSDNFEKKTKKLWPEAEKKGLKKEEVVVIASLVERESKYPADRSLVAGILIKRLKNDWPLQVDATIQYLKASRNCQREDNHCQWWPKITKKDLSLPSRYNTYLFTGLPPGPICNPSLSSLQATVNYQPSDYWFYLSDFQGKIHFARNLQEHEENIRRFIN